MATEKTTDLVYELVLEGALNQDPQTRELIQGSLVRDLRFKPSQAKKILEQTPIVIQDSRDALELQGALTTLTRSGARALIQRKILRAESSDFQESQVDTGIFSELETKLELSDKIDLTAIDHSPRPEAKPRQANELEEPAVDPRLDKQIGELLGGVAKNQSPAPKPQTVIACPKRVDLPPKTLGQRMGELQERAFHQLTACKPNLKISLPPTPERLVPVQEKTCALSRGCWDRMVRVGDWCAEHLRADAEVSPMLLFLVPVFMFFALLLPLALY